VADEVALLRAGRLIQRGKPADLATTPADPFVTEFIAAQAPPEALKWSR
jgi:ABC-type proline/glycine betaine transport system ATPase subunit